MRYLTLILCAGLLAACEPTPVGTPVTVVPYDGPPRTETASTDSTSSASSSSDTQTKSLQMASTCREAAARQLGFDGGNVAVSSPERTALGFVAFGQSIGGGSRFECTFDPLGNLRAVRAA